ncbi:MAG: mucoidy inhibitor MuiA family protein [Planctomycetes bacterium]|nr:mucoidy inhibitor MuiA family protein [Planctomycetota bacterium]NOG53873.1 DUF4139 domain-containing protein [Planctomycetota bacterium]
MRNTDRFTCRILLVCLWLMLSTHHMTGVGALASQEPLESLTNTVDTTGRIESVMVYASGQARFTQMAPLPATAGEYEVTVHPLPATVRPASLGVLVPDGIRLLSSSVAFTPNEQQHRERIARLRTVCREVDDQISAVANQLTVIKKEQAFYDALAERTAGAAATSVEQGSVDLDEVARVASFLAEQNERLAEQRSQLETQLQPLREQSRLANDALAQAIADGPSVEPAAVLRLRIPFDLNDGVAEPLVEITYLADGVGWQPVYDIRADVSGDRTMVQLDALIIQTTGLDWQGVIVSVSTGSPETPAQPPTLDTIPITVRRSLTPPDSTASTGREPSSSAPMLTADIGRVLPGQSNSTGADDTSGLLATFRVDEPTDVPNRPDEPLRIRLADWRLRTDFDYVAAPLVSQQAYVRAGLRNDSTSHWPPGQALLYRDGKRIGAAFVPHIHPGEQFQLSFGTDHLVSVQRQLIRRNVKTTGLLADGREVNATYQIRFSNLTGRTIALELWDRIPYTTDDRIKITVNNSTQKLDQDPTYQQELQPFGLLRWTLNVPTGPATGPQHTLEYALVVSHRKEIMTTTWPD